MGLSIKKMEQREEKSCKKEKEKSLFQITCTAIKHMWSDINVKTEKYRMAERKKSKAFYGNNENLLRNGGHLLEESVSLFHGWINPIRCFSIDELNLIKIDLNPSCKLPDESHAIWYKGYWERMCVYVKVYVDRFISLQQGTVREIAVATQMCNHKNVHKLIGCCLETKFPVLIYEFAENGTLAERILGDKNPNYPPLDWKDRLRIAWEIAHAVAYLHSGFRRPIIHRNLKPGTVFLDQDRAAKLSDFSLSISVPEGEDYVEDNIVGTFGYVAPEYFRSSRVAESADVYSFGVLFLVLLTGKPAVFVPTGDDDVSTHLILWVKEGLEGNHFCELIDPALTDDGMATGADLQKQLRASVELALRCTEEEGIRPVMIEVATELRSLILSS